ncbi:hypothetical protein GCM10028784_05350 [Myceligenerans cantabricum]
MTQIEELRDGDPRLAELYERLLVPSFPPHELDPFEEIAGPLATGDASVVVAGEPAAPAAIAVGHWSAASGVMLLSFLAVDPASRGAGIGGELLDHAVALWGQRYAPCLVVAELEHPLADGGVEAWGDHRRRYDFYLRHGARVLDLPYFQPALRPSAQRGYGMLLILLHTARELTRDECVASEPVTAFLRGYLEETEGVVEDAAAAALLDAAADPRGVGILPPDAALSALPRSAAAG